MNTLWKPVSIKRTVVVVCLLVSSLIACWGSNQDNQSITPTKMPIDISDGGFLTGEPCGPPCFWDITPGMTKEATVRQFIEDQALVEHCHDFNNEDEGARRGISCRGIMVVDFLAGSDVVASLGFTPSESITLEQVITRYGVPDAMLVTPLGLPESEPSIGMNIYYDDIHAFLDLGEQDGTVFVVTPLTQLTNIGYLEDETYQLLKPHYGTAWHGYGDYVVPPR